MDSLDIKPLKEAVVEAAWTQWSSLGANVQAARPARSMIDPEGLLLASLALRREERRLWDLLAAWARDGSTLFSIQRVKNLRDGFPEETQTALGQFAFRAKTDGSDHRWKSLAGAEAGPADRRQPLQRVHPGAWTPPALVLRLRMGFGVGVTADLVAFLISLNGAWANAKRIAQATGYTVHAVRRVADDLAAAGLLDQIEKKPVQYRTSIEKWRELLDLTGEPPAWQFWYQVYAFACQVLAAGERGHWSDLSPYLRSTRWRDLVERHQDGLQLARIDVPDPRRYEGERYNAAFAGLVSDLAGWIRTQA